MELLPPYWVVFAPRKYVPTGRAGPWAADRHGDRAAEPLECLRDLVALLGAEPHGVRVRSLDQHRVAVVGGIVVVAGVEVVAGEGLDDAAVVRVLRCGLRERRVVGAAVGALDHAGPVACAVENPHRERVAVGDEGVPGPDRHQLAVGADADPAVGVVAVLGRVLGPPGSVVRGGEVAGGVVRVVVVVEEVPAGDVVHEAVVVRVRSVAEGRDQVFGVEQARVAMRPGVGRDAGVADIVEDVEGAVAVGVVRARHVGAAPSRHGRGVRDRVCRGRGWGPAAPPLFRWICSRRSARSHLMPVSRIATTESGRPRSSFQAPDALNPEICGWSAFGPSW